MPETVDVFKWAVTPFWLHSSVNSLLYYFHHWKLYHQNDGAECKQLTAKSLS